MKKTWILFAVIGLTFMLTSCKPDISNQTQAALKKIKYCYEPGAVGVGGEESNQPKQIEALNDVATWDELCYIEAADSVSMHRLASFICILKRNPKYAKYLALSKIGELDGLYYTPGGCESNVETISALRIGILQGNRKKYGLSFEDSIEVDDAVLRAPFNQHIYYMYHLLNKLPPHPKYYSRLKEMFFKEHKLEALRALARYRNPELNPIILKAAEGIVDYPMDLDAYDKELDDIDRRDFIEKIRDFLHGPYTKEQLEGMLIVKQVREASKEFGNTHEVWHHEYEPFYENYNNPDQVKNMALKCIYENPSPAFSKYKKAAQKYYEENHEYYW